MTTIWKYKTWIAIAILCFICFGQLAYTNHLSGQLRKAQEKCNAQILKLEQQHQQAIQKQRSTINKLSADYETAKSEQRIKVETVTKYIDKIVERPIYYNQCIDDDGMQQLNSLIKSRDSS
ncbi:MULTISPECIES: hypothetical protein [unclassified Acinetobacter]|uniref:hypothetical protein n=1 Tax=unclassified Acinetobacter TaxID=196816 RepID=UPI002934F0E8|nr:MULTISPECIES: hypothetical protein [unclassified Acinetobacter]WOE32732.1 hypothetical protein QSG84_06015 [Acinetobacter sp. SAAs470]WOE38208.1 hypothetical protein QSG86_15070 [Acinetobacter sp. SAAs474]